MKDGIDIKIVEPNDAISFIQKRITSRRWWIFPVASHDAQDFVDAVEQAHYMKRNNHLFEMIILPSPIPLLAVAAIFLAAKSEMSPAELSKLAGVEIDGEYRDVVFTPGCPVAFAEWMLTEFKSEPTN